MINGSDKLLMEHRNRQVEWAAERISELEKEVNMFRAQLNGNTINSPFNLNNNVENFEEKKKALEVGRNKVDNCNKLFKEQGFKIYFIGGSVEEPVSLIKIDGLININSLPIIYKNLKEI